LDPEDIKILSMWDIWDFGKGTGLSWADIRFWGTKGQFISPRYNWTVRARTICKLSSSTLTLKLPSGGIYCWILASTVSDMKKTGNCGH
jgi:hypothetical protein